MYSYGYVYAGRKQHSARVHSAALHRAVGAGGGAGQQKAAFPFCEPAAVERAALCSFDELHRELTSVRVQLTGARLLSSPVFLHHSRSPLTLTWLIASAFVLRCRLRVAREARSRRLAVGRRAVRLHDDQIPLAGCATLTAVYLIPTGLRARKHDYTIVFLRAFVAFVANDSYLNS